jgi:hypothetical protein
MLLKSKKKCMTKNSEKPGLAGLAKRDYETI